MWYVHLNALSLSRQRTFLLLCKGFWVRIARKVCWLELCILYLANRYRKAAVYINNAHLMIQKCAQQMLSILLLNLRVTNSFVLFDIHIS